MFSAGILKLPASMAPLSMAAARCWLGRTPSPPAGRLSIAGGKARPIVGTAPTPGRARARCSVTGPARGGGQAVASAPTRPRVMFSPAWGSNRCMRAGGRPGPATGSARGDAFEGQGPQGLGPDLGVGGERQLLLGEEQDSAGQLVGGDATAKEAAHVLLVEGHAVPRHRTNDDDVPETGIGDTHDQRVLEPGVGEEGRLHLARCYV